MVLDSFVFGIVVFYDLKPEQGLQILVSTEVSAQTAFCLPQDIMEGWVLVVVGRIDE